ncbi:8480_t:CDS:2 [Paraglomus occultum]|uniref:8480_t:CDS:1 n=1 Tax=Paraglomus occultum TaxID=144539 RepID=A0A9N9AJZ3_9GLOM|nr:8480_t:CDS:2 [Paraglomus occultum]
MSYPYQRGNYPPTDNSYNNNSYGTPAHPFNVQGQPPSTPQSVANLNRQYSTDNLVGAGSVASEAGPLMTNTDARGFEFRHPEYGRVITQAETLIRIVPFWELIITNAVVLSRHIVTKATESIAQPNALNVFIFHACESENFQSDIDLCAASRLAWSLFGGAVLYFIIGTLISIFIAIECRRCGYPATFTALWNSPFFLFCYVINEKKKIDLLSIPNRLIRFRKWTRGHIQRIVMCLYCIITTALIAYDLTRRTVDHNDLDANRKYNENNSLYNIYNPYFLPYYVAIYFYLKMLISTILDIRALVFSDKPELVGIHYSALKLK